MTLLAALIVSLLGTGDPAPLVPGARVGGAVDGDTPIVESPVLLDPEQGLDAPCRGVTFPLALPADGPVTLTLRGFGFASYLVVRDAAGAVIAEGADEYYWMHARLELDDPAAARSVDAVSILGFPGRFELAVTAGPVATPERDDLRRLLEADAERILAADRDGVRHATPMLDSLAETLLEIESAFLSAELYRVVIRLHTEQRGEVDRRVGVAMNNLGIALDDAGDPRAARDTLVRALEILTETLGPDHENTRTTVGVLGTVERKLGDLDAAAARFARLIEIYEGDPDSDPTSLAVARLNFTVVRLDQHEPEGALPHLLAAIETFGRAFGPDHTNTAIARGHLVSLHLMEYEHEAALAAARENLASSRRALGEENPRTARALNDVAICLRRLDRLDEARQRYDESLDILRRTLGPEHPTTLQTMNNLGILLEEDSDFVRAEELLTQVVRGRRARNGPRHPSTGMAMISLAQSLRGLGRVDEEVALLEEAVSILEEAYGPDHHDFQHALSELSSTHFRTHRYDESLAVQRRILSARRERLGPDHLDTIDSEINVAAALTMLGRPAESIDVLEPLLTRYETEFGDVHQRTLSLLDLLVRAYHAAGRSDDVHAASLRTLRRSERRFLETLAARTEPERLRIVRADAQRLSWLLSQPVDLSKMRAEHEMVLRWKGQVSKGLRRDREALLGGADDETLEEVERLRELRRVLAQSDDGAGFTDELRRRLADDVAHLESELLRRLVRTDADDALDWDRLDRILPDGTAFLDLVVFDRRHEGDPVSTLPSLMTYAFRGPARKARVRIQLESIQDAAANLGAATAAARGLAVSLGEAAPRATTPEDAATTLYRFLVEPLEEWLRGTEHVVVCPDQFLGALPYGVLRDGDGRFLIERFKFTYVSDAGLLRLLERPAADREAARSILLAGEVDYGAGSAWDALPGTGREIDALTTRFPDATVLRGDTATAAAVRAALPDARLAHFATHGFFAAPVESAPRAAASTVGVRGKVETALLDDVPPGARAGLVLAGANDPTADAILTADEVGWLDLSNLDLVVLSACETGLGTSIGGEGMQSLQRAFHLAGARTVVASLWKVDDDATARLMADFYRGLDEGLSTSDALRAAQLALLAYNRETYGEPRPETWGAFVLSGDWR